MSFPLFQFITPLAQPSDPTRAISGAAQSLQGARELSQKDTQIANQASQFNQKFGLDVNDQLMRGSAQAHGEDQDAARMVLQYSKFLADGDDASAAAMAPAMKAIGVDLAPSNAPGQSPQSWHAQQSAPASTPVAQPEQLPKLGGADTMRLDSSIAPTVPKGAARPFAPGESVTNPDGSWSSERTMTVSHPALNNGAATNIPSIWIKDGKPYQAKNEDEAVQLAIQSGLPFKSYGDIGEADKASVDREDTWQKLGGPKQARGVEPLYNQTKKSKGAQPPPLLSRFMAAMPASDLAEEDPAEQQDAAIPLRGMPGDAKQAIPLRAMPGEQTGIPLSGMGNKLRGDQSVSIERSPLGGFPGPVSPGSATVEAGASPQVASERAIPNYDVVYRGKHLGTIDPNLFHAQSKETARRIGDTFLGSLPDTVAEGFRPGLEMPANKGEAKDAVDNDVLLALQGMRSAANRGKGGGKGGTGLEGVLADPKEAARLDGEIRQWTQAAAQDNGVKQLNQQASTLENAEAQLRSDLPADQRVGIASIVKSLNGANSSDKEADRIMSAAGGWAKWRSMVDQWVSSGQVDPALTQGLARMAASAHRRASERAALIAGNAADSILGDPLSGGRIPPAAKPAVRHHIITTITAESGGSPATGNGERPAFLK